MEQSNNSGLIKSTMTYGAFLGVAFIILHAAFYMTKALNTSLALIILPGLAYIVVFIGGIAYGTKRYRETILGGTINYRNALFCGALIALFAGLVYSFYIYIFSAFIDTGYFEATLKASQNTMTQFMLKYQVPDDQIEEKLKMFKRPIPPVFDMAISQIFSMAFFGFLVSLVTSAIIKNEPLVPSNKPKGTEN